MTSPRARTITVMAVGLTVVGLLSPHEWAPSVQTDALAVLFGATVLGELIGLRRPDGRQSRLSVAGLVALVVLDVPTAVVLAAALGALAVRWGREWAADGSERMAAEEVWSRVALAGSLSGVAVAIRSLAVPGYLVVETTNPAWEIPVLTVVAMLVLTVVAEPVTGTVMDGGRRPVRFRTLLRETWQADAVVAASGLLTAFAYPVLGQWVLLVVALPLLAAKVGLDRHAEIRLAYRQTLRAMSRLPEELGSVASGHGVRAGEVAKLAGQRLGLDALELQHLEYAAELHELGAIHAESAAHSQPELLGRAGADVIDEAGSELAPVAALVESRWRTRNALHGASVSEQLLILSCELTHRFEDPDKPGAFTAWARARDADPSVVAAIVAAAVQLGWPPLSFGPGVATAAVT